MANKTLELSIKIAGKMDKSLTAAIDSSQSKLGSLTKSLSSIGTTGLAAMGALGAGTLTALAACTKEAAKFENYMSDVVKVVDGMADETGKVSKKLAENGKTYEENYAALEERLKTLSTQIPYTFEDLTRLAAAAGQSGKTFNDLMGTDFLKDVAMWGTAMDISADQAGDWGAKWEQAFGMNHDQVMEVADVINYLGNNYATTAAEIAASVNDAASMGQIAGVDVKATAAIAASMQAMGVSADVTGTSIKRIYTNLTKGSMATKNQQKAMERIGFTATELAAAMQTDGTGTLLKVFGAINELPGEEKLSTLNALFGQWAIEGGAKVTQNLSLLKGMLQEISDPALWTGSMEKEFIIKATTPEAINTMLGSATSALMDDIGTALLPAYKAFGQTAIDFIAGLRAMPELQELTSKLGEKAGEWMNQLAEAMSNALPRIQEGLDYLLKNGDRVEKVVGGLAGAFAAMKFAPAIGGLLFGEGSLFSGAGAAGGKPGGLIGGVAGLAAGGQKTGDAMSVVGSAVKKNGIGTTASAVASSLISGGGLQGAAELIKTGAANPGILSAYPKASVAKAVGNTKAGGWLSSVGGAVGNLFGVIGTTKPGGAVKGALGTAKAAAGTKLAPAAAALGLAKGKVAGAAGTALSGAGGILNMVKGTAGAKIMGAGAGALGAIWGPAAGGFASLFAAAAPVVGVISAIIAVVSILGDNLGMLEPLFTKIFGEENGAAKFQAFQQGIQNVKNTFNDLVNGGVAQALSGFKEKLFGEGGIFAGNELGAGAFDGLTTILQSVMGVIGQIVSFATGTVKPIIEDIFGFITQTVVPVILQTFTAAAPTIASIISNIGSAFMTGMQIIGGAIKLAMPLIKGIITAILNIASVAIPIVLEGVKMFSQGIGNVMQFVKGVFDGLVTFITGVFSGNWSQAWEGVKQIFGNAFAALVELCKTPINAVIALINKAVDGINSLFGGGITIPDWVPEAFGGGKTFSLSLPHLPMLANGGFTNGTSIAGEAGTEAVISFRSGVRNSNIATWMQAGQMLGVSARQAIAAAGSGSFAELKALSGTNEVELKEIGGGDKGNNPDAGDGNNVPGQFVFAPQITVQGNADRAMMESVMADMKQQFEAWYEQMQRRRVRTAY